MGKRVWFRAVWLGVAVLLGSLLMVSQALAGESCHKINAKGVGQDHGDGTTTANIIGGGLLQGTTAGSFVITDFSQFPVLPFEGTVVFTTNNGTLTVTVTGTFNVSNGEFSASGPVTDATGKLARATGELELEGIENLSDGSFVEVVTGEICLP